MARSKPKRISTTSLGFGQWVAVMLYWNEGARRWDRWVTDDRVRGTKDEAVRDAVEWAEQDGLEYVA